MLPIVPSTYHLLLGHYSSTNVLTLGSPNLKGEVGVSEATITDLYQVKYYFCSRVLIHFDQVFSFYLFYFNNIINWIIKINYIYPNISRTIRTFSMNRFFLHSRLDRWSKLYCKSDSALNVTTSEVRESELPHCRSPQRHGILQMQLK